MGEIYQNRLLSCWGLTVLSGLSASFPVFHQSLFGKFCRVAHVNLNVFDVRLEVCHLMVVTHFEFGQKSDRLWGLITKRKCFTLTGVPDEKTLRNNTCLT